MSAAGEQETTGGRIAVGLVRLDAGKLARDHWEALRAALGDGELTEPDADGIFEARVVAGSRPEALQRVADAIAAAGADDHVAFAEHPDVPRHWQRRPT